MAVIHIDRAALAQWVHDRLRECRTDMVLVMQGYDLWLAPLSSMSGLDLTTTPGVVAVYRPSTATPESIAESLPQTHETGTIHPPQTGGKTPHTPRMVGPRSTTH